MPKHKFIFQEHKNEQNESRQKRLKWHSPCEPQALAVGSTVQTSSRLAPEVHDSESRLHTMSRRRFVEEMDPMDLLLDTVSNVFGGVMFLTLLAALLVINRGGKAISESQSRQPPQLSEVEIEALELKARQIELQIGELEMALTQQRTLMTTLDPTGDSTAKMEKLKLAQATLARVRLETEELEQKEQANAEQLTLKDAQLEKEKMVVEKLEQSVQQAQEELAKLQASSQRGIDFRPLRVTTTDGATVMMRYGRLYLLKVDPDDDELNSADIETRGGGLFGGDRMFFYPKPNGGSPVTSESINEMVRRLKKNFPSSEYHIGIAVWDDSFGEFNSFKEAIVAAGYEYRTIPADDGAKFSFGGSGNSMVQ
jgi:hypothetical protein